MGLVVIDRPRRSWLASAPNSEQRCDRNRTDIGLIAGSELEPEARGLPVEIDLRDISAPAELGLLRELECEIESACSCRVVVSGPGNRAARRTVEEWIRSGPGYRFDVLVELAREELSDVAALKAALEWMAGLGSGRTWSPTTGSIEAGIVVSETAIPYLYRVFDLARSEGLSTRFRMRAADDPAERRERVSERFDEVAMYHLVEFLEGLVAHGDIPRSDEVVYRALIESLQSTDGPSVEGQCVQWAARRVDRIRIEGGEIRRLSPTDAESVGPLMPLTRWSDFDAFEDVRTTAVDGMVASGPSGAARRMLIRSAGRLGAQKVVRKAADWTLGPYRRRASQRRFSRRIERLVEAAVPLEGFWSDDGARTRILICGWYGTETLGDKAILGGIVGCLQDLLGEIELVLVSLNPHVSRITRRQMPELEDARIVAPESGARLARSADLVVFGGGPLMALGVLAEMQAIFEVARLAGAATLVAGCGVGPLGLDWQNRSIRRILELSDTRIYRDERSRELAAALGLDAEEDPVAEDPAFSWLSRSRRPRPARPGIGRPVLLLGLREFPYRAYARHLDDEASLAARSRYEQAVLDALENLVLANPELQVRPLPMCTNHFGGDDRWFYRRLFRNRGPLADRLDFSLLGIEQAPEYYCEAFENATVAIAMRFHSLVFALGLGVPAVAIDYTLGKGKVNALADRFGIPQCSLADLTTEFLVREVQALLDFSEAQAPDLVPRFPALIKDAISNMGAERKA